MKKQIFLCDIDGTVALMDGRGPFDWNKVGEDKPNLPVIRVIRALLRDHEEVYYVSGRMEQCRIDTEDWLIDNLDMPFGTHFRLWMRKDDDFRPDEVVKREIYENEIAPHFEVLGVFDDRTRCVRLWRALGLTCFQVADGAFLQVAPQDADTVRCVGRYPGCVLAALQGHRS